MTLVRYDALLLVSFGGPEGPDDVMPFLRNVVQGRGVPDERLAEVAEHYQHFGGVSPINAQCRDLLAALRPLLDGAGVDLPMYWGNRNWHPYLRERGAMRWRRGTPRARVRDQPVRLVLLVPAVPRRHRGRPGRGRAGRPRRSTRSGTTTTIRATSGRTPTPYGQRWPNSPMWTPTRCAWSSRPTPFPPQWMRAAVRTADATSGQLHETARLVADDAGPGIVWDLVWQSRSGPPHVPWLEPDINDHLRHWPRPASGASW